MGGEVVASLTKLEGDDFVHGACGSITLEFYNSGVGLAWKFMSGTIECC